jgi:hypothetical protein
MSRFIATLSLLLALGANAGGYQKKDALKFNEVEVKFADGSTVRMVLVQDAIDIVTKFGKLSVPLSQVRGIDLGVHLPEGMQQRIEECIKRLNSDKFKDRDQALNELIEMGARAYPTLHQQAKAGDLEVQQRIQTALTKIKASVPENLLRLTTDDRIITTEFPIVGKIVSPAIKAKTQYFGDLDLKLTELRSIAWVAANLDTEVSIEAAKYAVKDQWLDTGVTLDGNSGVTIIATGEIDLLNDGSGEFVCGPTGSKNIGRRTPTMRLPGTLVGKIGDSGPVFVVGDRFTTSTAPAGKLYLSITPVGFNNGQVPSGAFKAVIRAGFFFGQ